MQSETLGKAGVSLLLISCYCQVPDFVVDGSHHSYLGMGFLRYIVYIYIYICITWSSGPKPLKAIHGSTSAWARVV